MIRTDSLAIDLQMSHYELVLLTEQLRVSATYVGGEVDGMAVYALREDAAVLVINEATRRAAEAAAPVSRPKRTPYDFRDHDRFGDEVR